MDEDQEHKIGGVGGSLRDSVSSTGGGCLGVTGIRHDGEGVQPWNEEHEEIVPQKCGSESSVMERRCGRRLLYAAGIPIPGSAACTRRHVLKYDQASMREIAMTGVCVV